MIRFTRGEKLFVNKPIRINTADVLAASVRFPKDVGDSVSNKSKIIIALAAVFGVLRFFVHPHDATLTDAYKDVVHVFMGVIGTLAWQGDRTCKLTFWLLCALEIIVAIVSRL